jgi:hypothetical protein
MSKLAPDMVRRIHNDFPTEEAQAIIELLSELQRFHPELLDRIFRCIVFYASGDFDRLARAVKMAIVDWRDLVAGCEYDYIAGGVRIRNFENPFGCEVILNPEKV